MSVQNYTQTTRRAPFLEAAQESYINLLTKGVGRAPGSAGVPTLAQLGPTVAPVDPLTQAAQQQAAAQAGLGQLTFDATTGAVTGIGTGTGVAGFQPFFDQAAAFSGPQAFQQFMSPYQQQVVDATLQDFDLQAQKGLGQIGQAAIGAGAFGGGRQGVAEAEYQQASDRNRAALQAQLLQQGFGQAQTLAQQAFEQQRGLASLQPSLAATSTQQLGTAGTGALAYSQALRDAAQQQAQLAYQEPYTRLGILGSGLASQAGGVPTTTQTQAPAAASASPLSQALQVGLTAYGLGSIFGGGK
jgi:hypothetical protein|tara:strand:- start:348 stop:1247 length:900 start_codon:yes stop_codon:yes gene_type:complete